MHTHNNDHNKNSTKSNTNKNTISPSATTVPQPPRTTSQACAACKYRRRKCTSDCILAPYFPFDRQPHFLNAHRLFGVSNIVKIVNHLSPPERDLAMRTIIFESDARATDSVGGCYRIIRDLEQRISLATAELELVLHHLAFCRAAAQAQRQAVVPPPDGGDYYDEVVRSLSMECTNDMITPILDSLVCYDDFREEEFKFDSMANVSPRFV